MYVCFLVIESFKRLLLLIFLQKVDDFKGGVLFLWLKIDFYREKSFDIGFDKSI